MSEDEIFKRMFGKERPPISTGRYVVIVDGMNVGDAEIDPSEDGSISSDFLRRVVAPVLLRDASVEFASATSGTRTRFVDLRRIGYEVRFDRSELALVLGVPMSKRTARVLPLNRPAKRGNVAFEEQADVSAYVSMRGGFDVVEVAPRDRGVGRFATDVDLGLNVRGVVAQARLRYDAEADRRFSRGDVRLTYDDLESLVRYELGDLTVNRRPYQIAPRIAGIAVYREYRIDPYIDYRTTGERGFELENAASVEIVVNGSPVRTFSLSAGRYNLRDLPLVSSATNDVEIRIREASGATRVIAFPAFTDIDLLDVGRTEFAVNAGVPYRDRDGVRVYDDGNFNLMAFYRRGMSSTLTLGASIEADKDLALVGSEISWASPVGTFNVNAGIDMRNPGLDSSRVSLLYAWRDAAMTRSLDAQVVLTGRDYRTLDGLFSGRPSSVFAQARYGQTISPDLRFQLGGSYERVRDERAGERWSIGGALIKQIGPLSLGASVDYQRDRGKAETIGRLSLFVPLGGGALSSSYQTRENAVRVDYNRITPAGVGSFGYYLGAERRDGADRQFARATYVGNRFEATVDQSRSASRGQSDVRTGVSFGTAIVMADGAFGWSRPVSNSFAIVENASPVDAKLAVEPRTGLGGSNVRYSAFADALGPAVVPDLPPYYDRPIEVQSPDAPVGSGLGAQIYQLKPGFRSGYRLKVGQGQGSVSALGVLVGRAGRPVAMATGEVRRAGALDDEATMLLFTNGAGRFFVEGLKPGERYSATVSLGVRTASFAIDVPADAVGIWKPAADIALDLEVPDAK